MGLFDKLGKAAGKKVTELKQLENMSNDQLIRQLKYESNSYKKIAILNIFHPSPKFTSVSAIRARFFTCKLINIYKSLTFYNHIQLIHHSFCFLDRLHSSKDGVIPCYATDNL